MSKPFLRSLPIMALAIASFQRQLWAEDNRAKDALTKIIGQSRALLDSDNEMADFSCKVRIANKNGDATEIAVACRKPAYSLVITSSALTYAVATEKVCVKLDTAYPGRLSIAKESKSSFFWGIDKTTGGVVLKLALGVQGQSRIIIDLPSVIRKFIDNAKSISQDEAGDYTVVTERNTLVVNTSPMPSVYPVKRVSIKSNDGNRELTISDVDATADVTGRWLGAEAGNFETFAAEKLIEPWNNENAVGQVALPPEGFWKDERNVKAGEEVTRSLRNVRPTTRPTTRSGDDAITTLSRAVLDQCCGAIDRQVSATSKVGLTAEQQDKVNTLALSRKALVEKLSKSVSDGGTACADAVGQAAATANMTKELEGILTREQFGNYRLQMLWDTKESNPISALLADVVQNAKALDLSTVQQDHLTKLCENIRKEGQALAKGVVDGKFDREAIKSKINDLAEELVDGLKLILTKSQYNQIEKRLLDGLPSIGTVKPA